MKASSPERLCKRHPNPRKDPNVLFDDPRLHLLDAFTNPGWEDINLSQTYVENRYEVHHFEKGMNCEFPDYFTNNCFAEASGDAFKSGKWTRVKVSSSLVKVLRLFTNDLPQLNLLAELSKISSDLLSEFRREYVMRSPQQRLLFIQAGVGTGKTTMLKHLRRVVVPTLNQNHDALSFDFVMIAADLNDIGSRNIPSSETWGKILAHFKKEVSENCNLKTTQDWFEIAKSEIYGKDGLFIPEVDTSPDKERTIKEIVHQSIDHKIFIRRACAYLATLPRPKIIVLVLDNVDIEPDVHRQAEYIDNFRALLHDCQTAIGITAVREYTLGDVSGHSCLTAFTYVREMHMTTPLLGEMVQKRIDVISSQIKDEILIPFYRSDSNETVYLNGRDLYRNLHSMFNEHLGAAYNKHALTTNLPDFLHNATNSNARLALTWIVRSLLCWALDIEKIANTFYWKKHGRSPVQLPYLSVDELVRLGALGPLTYYDRSHCGVIHNIFSFGESFPSPEKGRFPILIKYRALQYFASRGKTFFRQFMQDFSCFGYSDMELRELLEELIQSDFIESREGTKLEDCAAFFQTRKCWFYIHKFSKMLVYLENIRNDCLIQYESPLHECRGPLSVDVFNVLKFIRFLYEQELKEFQYISTKGELDDDITVRERILLYERIVVVKPLCWKLFKGVLLRCDRLIGDYPDILGTSKTKILSAMGELGLDILRSEDRGLLRPAMDPELRRFHVDNLEIPGLSFTSR